MVKNPTQWRTESGYDTVSNGNAGFSLLLETGSRLLSETAFKLLLEDSVVTPKKATTWTGTDKAVTSWEALDGTSSVTIGTGDTRITETGDTRMTEQGDTRITDLATFAVKNATVWVEL